MFNKPTGDKARDNRIDSIMRACKQALDNCKSQESMGIAVDLEEKKMYAAIGMAMRDLSGNTAADFSLNAHQLHTAIDDLTGNGNGQQSGPSTGLGNVDPTKAAGHTMSIAGQLIAQGVPPEVAPDMALSIVQKLIQEGADLDNAIINVAGIVKQINNGSGGFNPNNIKPGTDFGDLFNQAFKNDNNNNPFSF